MPPIVLWHAFDAASMIAVRDNVEAVRKHLQDLAQDLLGNLPAFAQQLTSEVIGLDEFLTEDGTLGEVLLASAEANVTTVAHVLRRELEPRGLVAPPAAVLFARRLAQRGVPVSVLSRAYGLGLQRTVAYFRDYVEREIDDLGLVFDVHRQLDELIFEYADEVTGQVVVAYQEEARIWLRSEAATQAGRIREMLRGGPIDVASLERSLGYNLRRRHLGLVLWQAGAPNAEAPLVGLDKAARRISQHLFPDARNLLVARDEATVFVWVPVNDEECQERLVAEVAPLLDVGMRVAVGAPGSGPEGFRTTARQALAAHEFTVAVGETAPSVVPYVEIEPISLMARDLELARAWVARVLGDLAVNDEYTAGFRETLRVSLSNGGSLRETAARLVVHKNTVSYRLRKAEELRGRPLSEDRLQLELALLACDWFGSAVLAERSPTR